MSLCRPGVGNNRKLLGESVQKFPELPALCECDSVAQSSVETRMLRSLGQITPGANEFTFVCHIAAAS